MKLEFKLGHDVEFFLKKGKEFFPSVGIIGGTKEEPLPLNDLGKGYSVQEDNVMLEVTVPPSSSLEEWIGTQETLMNYLPDYLSKIDSDLELVVIGSAEFNAKHLQSEQAKTFGCSPEFSAYTGDVNEIDCEEVGNLRSAGGHIHISWEGTHEYDVDAHRVFVRALDLFLGVPSVFLDPDKRRREVGYGKAGSHRSKEYGVEYRTLSNFWMKSPELIEWVYRNVKRAIEWLQVPENYELVSEDYFPLPLTVQDALDTNNTGELQQLIKDFDLEVEVVTKGELAKA